jgi:hypothetical protein
MRILIFILFSALIGYLTKNIWLQLNHWYYMIFFLMVIILIPFILYSIAGKIAFETGWLVGLITMITFTIIDNYLTNAMSLNIISKSNNGFFDTSGFKLSLDLLKLPWYTYLVSGTMGLITGIIGDKQRKREKEREQRAIFLGLYLLAGQFLGMAVPELTPIISRVTPVVTTVMTAEVASKTGSLAIAESSKIAEKNTISKTEPAVANSLKTTGEIKPVRIPKKSIDANRPYMRKEIDIEFIKIKTQLHQEAVQRGGDGKALFKDVYTGQVHRGGDIYDYDHIRSAEEIYMKYRSILNDEEIAKVVNCKENLGVTSRSLNQSKGKSRMEDLLNNPAIISKYKIDPKLTRINLAKADKGIARMVKKIAPHAKI